MPDTAAGREPLVGMKISMGIRMPVTRTSQFGWKGTPLMCAMLLLLVSSSTAAGASAGAVGLCQSAMIVFVTLSVDTMTANHRYRRCTKADLASCSAELRIVQHTKSQRDSVRQYLGRYCDR